METSPSSQPKRKKKQSNQQQHVDNEPQRPTQDVLRSSLDFTPIVAIPSTHQAVRQQEVEANAAPTSDGLYEFVKSSLFKTETPRPVTPPSPLTFPSPQMQPFVYVPNKQDVSQWGTQQVSDWLTAQGFGKYSTLFTHHGVTGEVLLLLHENELITPMGITHIGDVKKLNMLILKLKQHQQTFQLKHIAQHKSISQEFLPTPRDGEADSTQQFQFHFERKWTDGDKSSFSKLLASLVYMVVVCFITSFTMTLVHDRIPDQKNYPPLPDIFLDNIQLIPWAFTLVEYIIMGLITIFLFVLLLHSHRMIILRRFCVISGTVFLLRCITMYLTSLSVPGVHLQCDFRIGSSLDQKLAYAWDIFRNFALSVNGVRTCGDYMFSGHSSMLTLLNFFINEYTPLDWRGLNLLTWSMNLFGMFFVLAAHEHYSIDVFIAFFIASRLFLYYHSLANNNALSRDVNERIRSFWPLFGYWEEFTDGVLPNEYDWPPWTAIQKWRRKFTKQKHH